MCHLCMHTHFLSCVWLFATQWTVAHQAPLPMGFPKLAFWTGLPFSPPGDLPDPGINSAFPASPAWHTDSSPLSQLGSPCRVAHQKKTDKANQNFTQLIFLVLFLLYQLFIHRIILYSIKVLIYLMHFAKLQLYLR